MSAAAWDRLHRDPRHRLEYPSEHVVRWARSLNRKKFRTVADIGCGSGRHSTFFVREGFDVTPFDASTEALLATNSALARMQNWTVAAIPAEMDELRGPALRFDAAISYGVFYYGTPDEHRQAVAEMHRVLRPGGKAFVCIRTGGDWRKQFTHGGVFRHADEPEDGMPMHFLSEYEVRVMYGAFSEVGLELTETTRKGRTRCDSDWLVELTK